MTQSRDVILNCDGELPSGSPCPETFGAEIIIRTAKNAREMASEQGWTNRGAEDYCPRCSGDGR